MILASVAGADAAIGRPICGAGGGAEKKSVATGFLIAALILGPYLTAR